MVDNEYSITQTVALVSELKKRFTTLNGYLKGDIQNLENIKELYERRQTNQIGKLQLNVDRQWKHTLLRNSILGFIICLITASIIVYSGIFEYANLLPQMNDIASSIHVSSHANNVLFEWILPITITTLIFFLVSIVVVGLIVLPIAKICDIALADIHRDTQTAVIKKQLAHDMTVNAVQLGIQTKRVNTIIDGLIRLAQEKNDESSAEYLKSVKDDLLAHAILHHGYYNVLLAQITK